MSTPEDQTSPTQVEERVIVTDVHKHPPALADATRVYAEATSSSVCFLIAENEWMVKELQVAKQGGDLETMSTQAKLKKVVIRALYSKFSIMHQAVVHLHRS